jgi:hypothetical protein
VLPVLANGVPVQTLTTFVTAQCFDAFGIQPLMGRVFTGAEAPVSSRGGRVALISHRLWTNTFFADPSVLGRTVQVNTVEVTIIGVLPRGFLGVEIDHTASTSSRRSIRCSPPAVPDGSLRAFCSAGCDRE